MEVIEFLCRSCAEVFSTKKKQCPRCFSGLIKVIKKNIPDQKIQEKESNFLNEPQEFILEKIKEEKEKAIIAQLEKEQAEIIEDAKNIEEEVKKVIKPIIEKEKIMSNEKNPVDWASMQKFLTDMSAMYEMRMGKRIDEINEKFKAFEDAKKAQFEQKCVALENRCKALEQKCAALEQSKAQIENRLKNAKVTVAQPSVQI